ncbi:3607_t:CDS:2, partial [Dentiscutata erythropus]
MNYSISYRKRLCLTWIYRGIVRNRFIAGCLLMTVLIATLYIHLNRSYTNSISFQIQEINKRKTHISNISNIIVVIDDEQHANNLQPIYCNLHRKTENVSTHVIVTGRGISGKELIKSNSLLPNCDITVYDLELQKSIFVNENFLTSIFKGISGILNQIQPDVLIYINDFKNEAMRAVDAALVSASQTNNTITKIALPLEHAKYMMWLTDLSIEALKNWNTPNIQIQVITQNRPSSLIRLMQSLGSSIYFGDDVHLTINIDRSADPITVNYCQTFEWNFGQKSVRYRIKQGGLINAVVESYYPATNDEYAIILEDDIE